MSNELAILSVARAGLPRFGQPGDNYATQLLIGRDAAASALKKYVPTLSYDEAAASQTLREIDAWASRNDSDLSVVMSDPSASALPSKIQTSLGSDKASAFLVASFTTAAAGLGPWMSGAVEKAAASGGVTNTEWARVDAETRLQVFGGIVKMENDGQLAKFFVPPTGTSGFGLAPVVIWAIVVAVVAIAALILTYMYASKRLEANNKLMREICLNAQRDGDVHTVDKCVNMTADLQSQGFMPTSWVAIAVGGAAVVGGLYVAARYAPWDKIFEHWERP